MRQQYYISEHINRCVIRLRAGLTKERFYELGGFVLVGIGVLLLLANLMYTPVYRYLIAITKSHIQSAGAFSSPSLVAAEMGSMLFLPAFACMSAGYAIIRRYMPRFAIVAMGLVFVEMLAGSSVLGWLLIISDYYTPFPNAVWGLLIATWLSYKIGLVGAVTVPLMVMTGCFWGKHRLREQRPEPVL